MKISCEYGEFDVFGYIEPGSRRIDRAVSVESLVNSLGLSLKRLPYGEGIRHVEMDGQILVPIRELNLWLVNVKADSEVINRLSLHLSARSGSDVGFLSYAHLHLEEALSSLGAYYIDNGFDAEYPVEEVEDSLYQIFCEFLTCGSYDPMLMERDRMPMTASEAWMLSILETTAAELILEFIEKNRGLEDILTYLQIMLKDHVSTIGARIADMATHFKTPEDL